ncbi:uncharacterized protein G2W53_021212 [Senna tora]|uniref:Uncharacterized protein n=1 Tax=Senna tora TaxID=362788 RepID=A0A834WJC7_9FABA|nr:uncharacterized protein G2W53_021212 [Senna tora]
MGMIKAKINPASEGVAHNFWTLARD